MSAADITVAELKNMLRGVDGRTKIRLIVTDDECGEIKMTGSMDYIRKPKKAGGVIVFLARGEANIG